jgi:hypothetical protein
VLKNADVLVGIFWTRVGSPTGKAISGSIEEIEEHMKSGKPTMLYFSEIPVVMDTIDLAQYDQLKAFKAWAIKQGLIERFESREDFRSKFRKHLPMVLRDNQYLRRITQSASPPSHTEVIFHDTSRDEVELSEDARELLKAAAGDRSGTVLVLHYLGGATIQSGGKAFVQSNDQRQLARWEAAVEELAMKDLVRDPTGKGELFRVTHAGYQLVERLT